MRKFITSALTLAAVLTATACSNQTVPSTAKTSVSGERLSTESLYPETIKESSKASTITISHDPGQVEVPYNPQKIAVLDLAALDIIDALGLGDRVVAIPKKSSVSYLTSYVENEAITNAGSVKEVDMEALHALEPDLIFIGGRLSSEYDNIAKIAPTVLLKIDNSKGYINSFKENVTAVSSIFGLEETAAELLSGFDSRITALKTAAEGKTAIIGMVSSSSLSTLGNDSRCSLIGNEIGFTNSAAEVDSTHGDTASFELVLDKNPDYLFILDRDTAINSEGAKAAKEVMENDIIKKTSAWQNNQIIYLTPDVWYLAEGGITATDTMLKDLEASILN